MGWLFLVLSAGATDGDAPAAAVPVAVAPAGAALSGEPTVADSGEPAPEASAPAESAAAPTPAAVAAPVPAVPRGPERWTPPPEVLESVRASRTLSIGERVERASRAFLGLPYLNDAAGEGEGIDPDPPSRYDAFDCLTFVEEVLALTLAGDPLYAPAVRDAFRYAGAPSYDRRRHFMEAQWIPDAIRNGLLEDITARVGRARVLRKDVTAEVWRRWRRRGLFQLPDAALPLGEWAVTYLDLAEALEAVPRIPAGALVVTLREERAWSPIVATHISMVVPPLEGSPPGAENRMRHATRMGHQTVRDDRLGWYAAHLRDYVNWPSLGIAVLMPREQGPRISALQDLALPPAFPMAEGPRPAFEAQPIPPFPRPATTLGAAAGAVPLDESGDTP